MILSFRSSVYVRLFLCCPKTILLHGVGLKMSWYSLIVYLVCRHSKGPGVSVSPGAIREELGGGQRRGPAEQGQSMEAHWDRGVRTSSVRWRKVSHRCSISRQKIHTTSLRERGSIASAVRWGNTTGKPRMLLLIGRRRLFFSIVLLPLYDADTTTAPAKR